MFYRCKLKQIQMQTIKVVRPLMSSHELCMFKYLSTLAQSGNVGSSTSIRPADEIPGPTRLDAFRRFFPFNKQKKKNLDIYFRELHEKYGKIVKLGSGHRSVIILFDPHFIHKVYMNEGKYPERFSIPLLEVYQQRTKKLLFSTRHGEEWYAIRGPMQQKIKPSSVAGYLLSHQECAENLVTWIEQNKGKNGISVRDPIMRYIVDANSAITINKKLGFVNGENRKTDPNEEVFLEKINDIFSSIQKSLFTFPMYRFLRTPMYNKFEDAMNVVLRVLEGHIKEKMVSLQSEEDTEDGTNLLRQCLIDDRLTIDDILVVMFAFLFGGVEMTTNSLMWLIWILGMNQEKQEVLHKEIQDTFGDVGKITTAKLGHMPYLKACIKESFRYVFPTVNGGMRVIPEDLEIGGYLIPKGTSVHFGHNTLCQSNEYFDSPDKYIPERWLSGVQKQMTLCALPFGLGKRNCLGRGFADQEIQIAVIKILQRFKISVPEDSKNIEKTYTLFATPDKPIKIIFISR